MEDKLIRGIHHISLKPVGYEAFQKTAAFYQEVLGLEVVRSWGEGDASGIMLKAGSDIVEIMANGTEKLGTGTVHHYAFATDQVDELIEKVRQAGYEVTTEPVDRVIQSTPPLPIRIAFFTGPCGESVELFCER